MHSKRNVLRVFLGGCLGLGVFQAGVVSASSFKIDPIQVVLAGAAKSALLTLTNQSDQPLRFEVTAFAWDQGARGEIELQPTDDILFFPKLFSVAPGKEQKIRVGTTASALQSEKTYRVFVEELRPLEKPKEPAAGSQVRVLTKMGIPIFLRPATPSPAGAIADLTVAKAVVSFEVKNAGNVHFSLYGVRVVGTTATGETVFERKAEGWYVLAGGSRTYEISLSPQECGRLEHVVVEATTDIGSFKGQADIGPDACSTPTPAPGATPAGAEHGMR